MHHLRSSLTPVKNALKHHAPRFYAFLCTVKDWILPAKRQWGKYYDASPAYAWLHIPETCLVELKPFIPKNIDTILNLGCGAGRYFIPFDGDLKLWGLDIVPFEHINWLRKFKDLRYTQAYIEDFTKELEKGAHDLSKTLVYSHGTMMYLTKTAQERFFAACEKAGATIFIFSEYPFGTHQKEEYFQLDPQLFKVLRYRPEGETLVYTTLPQVPQERIVTSVPRPRA